MELNKTNIKSISKIFFSCFGSFSFFALKSSPEQPCLEQYIFLCKTTLMRLFHSEIYYFKFHPKCNSTMAGCQKQHLSSKDKLNFVKNILTLAIDNSSSYIVKSAHLFIKCPLIKGTNKNIAVRMRKFFSKRVKSNLTRN